jgi:CubicO group peptidase (beta-lactamase class C family)
MFTVVAAAQLMDEGKVKNSDPVGKYVPGLTREASAVTVRQLLAHTSGLGNFFTPENLPVIEKARGVADLLPLVANEKPAFPPGSKTQYSNVGYLLLGALVERVSGQSYGDYLRNHIFAPAGMTATSLEGGPGVALGMTRMPARGAMPPPPQGAPHESPQVTGPVNGPAQMNGPPHIPPQVNGPLRPAKEAALRGNPAGGAFSTVADLRRFFRALLGKKLVSDAMLAALTTPDASTGHALGFGTGSADGHRWFGHNGGAPGINVEAVAFTDDGRTVIVLSNRDPPTATQVFRALLDGACGGNRSNTK